MKLEKKLVFIFNPKAGKGKIKTSLMDIVDIFNKGGYEVIIRATQAPEARISIIFSSPLLSLSAICCTAEHPLLIIAGKSLVIDTILGKILYMYYPAQASV